MFLGHLAKHRGTLATIFFITLFVSVYFIKQQSLGGVEHKLVILTYPKGYTLPGIQGSDICFLLTVMIRERGN